MPNEDVEVKWRNGDFRPVGIPSGSPMQPGFFSKMVTLALEIGIKLELTNRMNMADKRVHCLERLGDSCRSLLRQEPVSITAV